MRWTGNLSGEEVVILHFHIAHNAPRLLAKFFHNYFSLFLLGNTVVPREIEDNGYANFWGINKVQ